MVEQWPILRAVDLYASVDIAEPDADPTPDEVSDGRQPYFVDDHERDQAQLLLRNLQPGHFYTAAQVVAAPTRLTPMEVKQRIVQRIFTENKQLAAEAAAEVGHELGGARILRLVQPRYWPHFTGTELHEHVVEPLECLPLLGQSGYIVKGGTHVLAAAPKAGKTSLLMACIREWVRSGHKVIVFSEESQRTWDLRIRQVPRSDGDGLDNLVTVPGIGMTTADMMVKIQEVGQPDVLVIDTLRTFLGIEDENDNARVARAIQPWTEYSQQTGCTLILLHHTRKSGGEHGEGVSGAYSLNGAVDNVLQVGWDASPNRRTVEVMGRLVEPQKVVYERSEVTNEHGVGSGSYEMRVIGAVTEVTRADVQERVQMVLLRDIAQTTTAVRDALGDPKPSADTVTRVLVALVGLGLAQRQPPIDEDAKGRAVTWTAV